MLWSALVRKCHWHTLNGTHSLIFIEHYRLYLKIAFDTKNNLRNKTKRLTETEIALKLLFTITWTALVAVTVLDYCLFYIAMMSWLFGETSASIITGKGTAPPLPSILPQQFRDANVLSSIGLLSPFADVADIRDKINQSVCMPWDCAICHLHISDSSSICCDRCVLWCHFACAKLNRAPRKKAHWFCARCKHM